MKRKTPEYTINNGKTTPPKKTKNHAPDGITTLPHSVIYTFPQQELEEHEHAVPMIDTEPPVDEMDHEQEKKKEGYLLRSLLYPKSKEWFMENVFRRRAFATRGAPVERTQALVDKHMYGLDLDMLLHQTASERVHVWMKEMTGEPSVTSSEKKIDSFATEEAETAMICHRAGASLYFRAPPEMENDLISDLGMQLGMNWSGIYANGQNRSEIEVFISRKGHKTNVHFDFMENFTVQISGVKKWRFKKSGIDAPLRGCTPHYKNHKNIEQQLKLAQSQNPDFTVLSGKDEEDFDEVILGPGDVLYHPAGIWHSVECMEDSISINLSFVGSTYADLLADGVRQMLWKKHDGRSFVSNVHNLKQARHQLETLLEQFKRDVNQLRVEDLIPANLLLPRRLRWDLSEMASILGDVSKEAKVIVKSETRWRKNPLAILITYDRTNSDNEYPSDSDNEDEDDEDEGCGSGCESDCESEQCGHKNGQSKVDKTEEKTVHTKYYIHSNFGNEEIESLVRITLMVPDELLKAIEFIRRHDTFATKDVAAFTDDANNLLQVLQINGLVSPM